MAGCQKSLLKSCQKSRHFQHNSYGGWKSTWAITLISHWGQYNYFPQASEKMFCVIMEDEIWDDTRDCAWSKQKNNQTGWIPGLLPNNKVKPKKEVKNTWITQVCGSVEEKEVLKIVAGLRNQKDEKNKAKTDKLKDLLKRKKHSINLRKSGNVECKNVKLLV